jgi:phage antirepressor YoqD-like protein
MVKIVNHIISEELVEDIASHLQAKPIKKKEMCKLMRQQHVMYKHILYIISYQYGDRGGTVVKGLCYKSEGRWFDSRWCHWNFSLI